jgi:hypothetical protein
MKTYIKTAHEEGYSNSSKTLGVLLNYNENYERIDSLVYIYRSDIYIFFNTIMDMNEYLLYGDSKIKRAYISEEDFDKFWDALHIDGKFTEHLKWS